MSPIINRIGGTSSAGGGINGMILRKKYVSGGPKDTWFVRMNNYSSSQAYFRSNGNIVTSQANVIYQIDKDANYIANSALSVPVSGSIYNSFAFNKTADVAAVSGWNYPYEGENMPVAYVPLSSSSGSSIKVIRGPGSGYAAGAYIDNSGNLYRGCQAGTDGHFHKINSSGVTQWGLKFASVFPHNANSRSVGSSVVDSSGNVYVSVYAYSSDVSVGALSKYNSSGTLQWRNYYGASTTVPDSLYIDSSGYVYFLVGTGTYGTTPFWLVKIDGTGAIVWQQKYDLSGPASPYNFGGGKLQYIDGSGNMYITIGWSTSGNYGYSTLLKVDSSRNVLWANSLINGFGHGMTSFDIDPSFPDYYIISGAQGNVSIGSYGAYILKGRTNGTIPGGGNYGGYTMSNNNLTVSTASGTISATSRSITGTTADSLSSSNQTLSSSSNLISSKTEL